MAKLLAPVSTFAQLPLEIPLVSPSKLYRVSGHNSGEPHFGRNKACRFDDPTPKKGNVRFGTCYLGFSLDVAIAESLLHDVEPAAGKFAVPVSEVERRYVFRFSGPELRLANLTGMALLLLGGNGELSGTPTYGMTRKWAKAVFDHPEQVDGFLYMSRRVNDSVAVVLFERNAVTPLPLTASKAVKLELHPEFAASARKLRLTAT